KNDVSLEMGSGSPAWVKYSLAAAKASRCANLRISDQERPKRSGRGWLKRRRLSAKRRPVSARGGTARIAPFSDGAWRRRRAVTDTSPSTLRWNKEDARSGQLAPLPRLPDGSRPSVLPGYRGRLQKHASGPGRRAAHP